MSPARLHVVTSDQVLESAAFVATARAILARYGPDVALHLRGHGLSAARLLDRVRALVHAAREAGSPLLVADRADVALAAPGTGLRLGRHSIPVAAARALLPGVPLAWSAHGVEEGAAAVTDGADLVVLGTIWATASHPGREPAGLGLLEAAVAALDAPVVAIGGVTPERAATAVRAGARGVAVLRGVWSATDPLAAVGVYLDAMNDALGHGVEAGRGSGNG